ncbi:MAG: hypothetical protein EZS28_022856, partial [Streblomastix strix]
QKQKGKKKKRKTKGKGDSEEIDSEQEIETQGQKRRRLNDSIDEQVAGSFAFQQTKYSDKNQGFQIKNLMERDDDDNESSSNQFNLKYQQSAKIAIRNGMELFSHILCNFPLLLEGIRQEEDNEENENISDNLSSVIGNAIHLVHQCSVNSNPVSLSNEAEIKSIPNSLNKDNLDNNKNNKFLQELCFLSQAEKQFPSLMLCSPQDHSSDEKDIPIIQPGGKQDYQQPFTSFLLELYYYIKNNPNHLWANTFLRLYLREHETYQSNIHSDISNNTRIYCTPISQIKSFGKTSKRKGNLDDDDQWKEQCIKLNSIKEISFNENNHQEARQILPLFLQIENGENQHSIISFTLLSITALGQSRLDQKFANDAQPSILAILFGNNWKLKNFAAKALSGILSQQERRRIFNSTIDLCTQKLILHKCSSCITNPNSNGQDEEIEEESIEVDQISFFEEHVQPLCTILSTLIELMKFAPPDVSLNKARKVCGLVMKKVLHGTQWTKENGFDDLDQSGYQSLAANKGPTASDLFEDIEANDIIEIRDIDANQAKINERIDYHRNKDNNMTDDMWKNKKSPQFILLQYALTAMSSLFLSEHDESHIISSIAIQRSKLNTEQQPVNSSSSLSPFFSISGIETEYSSDLFSFIEVYSRALFLWIKSIILKREITLSGTSYSVIQLALKNENSIDIEEIKKIRPDTHSDTLKGKLSTITQDKLSLEAVELLIKFLRQKPIPPYNFDQLASNPAVLWEELGNQIATHPSTHVRLNARRQISYALRKQLLHPKYISYLSLFALSNNQVADGIQDDITDACISWIQTPSSISYERMQFLQPEIILPVIIHHIAHFPTMEQALNQPSSSAPFITAIQRIQIVLTAFLKNFHEQAKLQTLSIIASEIQVSQDAIGGNSRQIHAVAELASQLIHEFMEKNVSIGVSTEQNITQKTLSSSKGDNQKEKVERITESGNRGRSSSRSSTPSSRTTENKPVNNIQLPRSFYIPIQPGTTPKSGGSMRSGLKETAELTNGTPQATLKRLSYLESTQNIRKAIKNVISDTKKRQTPSLSQKTPSTTPVASPSLSTVQDKKGRMGLANEIIEAAAKKLGKSKKKKKKQKKSRSEDDNGSEGDGE